MAGREPSGQVVGGGGDGSTLAADGDDSGDVVVDEGGTEPVFSGVVGG